MKVSVSLPDDDVSFVDDYANRRGSASRSAVLHRAIELLRLSELEDAYADAWAEWHDGDDGRLWQETAADGLADAAR
ncbi:Arc/MetJ-type ribon-helix-helix transcriptional regulator [Allocatelliglobosispora scoriae]|uniref:Arc/MetJ-type ribon-helix-helix transcriptional regulator n=1 Tax=Allocatelliglobosispora scoriae TaxID=643052 RepID=A0A841BXH4_9ACTN|nr:ribbon-helix-helix domain-containing protein [Allocatelliglobosispora scoriae]MBB5872365.1 Arc/MetJ-type ribon-helix-helix transcriptional regulator [Allocatelliglobosispora scoriae]